MKDLSRVTLGCGLALLAQGAKAQSIHTLGEAREQAVRLRKGLVSGSATFSAVSSTIGSKPAIMGNTSTGEIRFDHLAYTNRHRRITTSGYTYTRTSSDGKRHEGLDPLEDAVFLRRPAGDLAGMRLIVNRYNGHDVGSDLLPPEWESFGLPRDLLALGLVLPEVKAGPQLDAIKLDLDAKGMLVGRGYVDGATIEVKVSPDQGYLITDVTVERKQRFHLTLDEVQTIGTFSIPHRITYMSSDDHGWSNKIVSTFDDIHLNDRSTAFSVPIKTGTSVFGWRDNGIYRIDRDGRPVLMSIKGSKAERSQIWNYVYVGSLAVLLFVASGTLVRSLLRRRKR